MEKKFMKGAQDFLAVLKKQWKNKYEKKNQQKVRSSIKTLRQTEIIMHMRGSPPPYTSLFALKYFLVILTIYSMAFVIQGSFLRNRDKILTLV